MAREATITQEQVNAIADGLHAKRCKPTARAVRDQLGTGSMGTILKLLQVWQAGQVRPADTPVALPPGLQRFLVDFVAQEVAAAKSALQEELVDAQQANGDLIAESERQAAIIASQAEELDLAQAERAELTGRLQQMERDLADAREEAVTARHAAECARTELAKTQLRLESLPRLEADVDRLRTELEKERSARIAAEQNAAVLSAKLEAEASSRKKAETAATELSKQKDEAMRQAFTASEALGTERVTAQKAQSFVESLTRELEASKAEARKAHEVAAELRGKLEVLSGKRG